MKKNGVNEKTIINTLLVVCLSLGFLCVTTIYLPSKVGNSLDKQPAPSPLPRLPANALVAGGEGVRGRPPIELSDGTLVRFTPEPDPPPLLLLQEQLAKAPSGEAQSKLTRVHRQSSLSLYDPGKPKDPRGRSWFAVPPELEADVEFWRNIYSKYDSHEVVLHDKKYLPIIYGVLDFTDLDANTTITDIEREKQKQAAIDAEKESIIAILDGLSANPARLSERGRYIKQLFNVINEPDKFKKAKERGVRAQTGQKDIFIAGLAYSNRYLGEMESIFEHMGLPHELVFLVFVESMFNPIAASSAGAKGVWQFMKSTGKIHGLKINKVIDERADPIRSTYAAASLLSHDYEIFGKWPLAINAYNTGRERIKQAMARLGTSNIATIIKYFDHPLYGFASRNFYLEFLAALDVAKNYRRYFGNVRFDPPMRYDVVRIENPVPLPDVARATGIPIETIAEMNPAYSPSVFSGKLPLPPESELRVPAGKGELFLAYAARALGR